MADGGSNSIRTVNLHTGEAGSLTTFAPLLLGSSRVRAVPVGLRFYGDQLLVPFLTGLPFPANVAQVQIVDLATGSDAPFITGLTAATDMLPLRGRGRTSAFLTLELTGQLRHFATADAQDSVVIADCLTPPTSMARDERTGDLFVTEILTGRIVKVAAAVNSIDGNSLFGFEPQPIAAEAQRR